MILETLVGGLCDAELDHFDLFISHIMLLHLLSILSLTSARLALSCYDRDIHDMFLTLRTHVEKAEKMEVSELLWDEKFTDLTIIDVLDVLLSVITSDGMMESICPTIDISSNMTNVVAGLPPSDATERLQSFITTTVKYFEA